MGLDVPIENIWTAALATAKFLDDQRPNAYVIGEADLTTALHDIDCILTDHEPDYVLPGETRTTKEYLARTCGLSASVIRRPRAEPNEKALPRYQKGLLLCRGFPAITRSRSGPQSSPRPSKVRTGNGPPRLAESPRS
ncbi:hypothetical protein GCM10010251_66230 [Streptomyces aurantiogriseus]|uniref:Uncharacterized protein n=1 Tax=Streptomyces aurantiogriseus TaxID=66870 RepID=A0A918FIR2_9ACTN|nr:hypothetical protein GCM10010251_66230 [Streptomyces aurantiogriseus]